MYLGKISKGILSTVIAAGLVIIILTSGLLSSIATTQSTSQGSSSTDQSVVIRVWLLQFTTSDLFNSTMPKNVINELTRLALPGVLTGGEEPDWLIDAQITKWNGGNNSVISQERSGHSRYFMPQYIDMTIHGFNRTQLIGQTVQIEFVAYWHISDAVIDINPTAHHLWNDVWDGQNNELSINYVIGSKVGPFTIRGDGKPRDSMFPTLIEPRISNWYSYATMTYRIETF